MLVFSRSLSRENKFFCEHEHKGTGNRAETGEMGHGLLQTKGRENTVTFEFSRTINNGRA